MFWECEASAEPGFPGGPPEVLTTPPNVGLLLAAPPTGGLVLVALPISGLFLGGRGLPSRLLTLNGPAAIPQ